MPTSPLPRVAAPLSGAVPVPALVAAAIVLAAAVAVLLVLALIAVVRATRSARALRRADADRSELRLSLAEQTDRLRVVGELDGVAAVTVSALADRADRLRLLASTDPDAAGRLAAELATEARTAVGDLRRAADLARAGERDAAELGASPTLDELDAVLRRDREPELRVEVREDGRRPELPASAALTVLRIVDEALDNAARHGAAGTTARVALRWSRDGVQLTVDDDGERTAASADGVTASGGGYSAADDLAALTDSPYGAGLTELRHRAESFGGVVALSRTAGVGFTVSVSIPNLRVHNGVHGVAF